MRRGNPIRMRRPAPRLPRCSRGQSATVVGLDQRASALEAKWGRKRRRSEGNARPQARLRPVGFVPHAATPPHLTRACAGCPTIGGSVGERKAPLCLGIAEKAKQLQELGISEKEIARALGVSDKTVAKAERACRRGRFSQSTSQSRFEHGVREAQAASTSTRVSFPNRSASSRSIRRA
jgi:hypothetical protein